MKRHKSLYPLSHDHHHALVQARKLRIASSDPSLHSLHNAAGDFIAFWDSNLQLHFRQEEEILLPLFSKYSSADRVEIIETLKQHVDIRRTFKELREKTTEGVEPEAESMQQLAALLEKHIRYEENQLFPAIEGAVPEEELWEMNRLIVKKTEGGFTMSGQAESNEPISKIQAEQTIRQIDKQWVAALIRGDTATLDRVMADDCVFTYALDGDDKAQFIRDIETGDLKVDVLNRDNVEVRIYGSTGVLIAFDTAGWKYRGREIKGHYRSMHVYSENSGVWQIVAIQASPISLK